MPPETAAEEVQEYFGDAPDTEDLSALDRGDSFETFEPAEPEAPTAEEGEGDPAPESDPEPVAKSDPEPEPEPEPVAEPDPEPDPEPVASIPKARLDSQIAKTRDLERRLAIAEQAAKPEPTPEPEYDVVAKTREEYEAVIRGDLDAAAALRVEISDHLAAKQTIQMQELAQQATVITKEQLVFDDVVQNLTEDYPVFNTDHETFDQELLDSVLFKRDAYHNTGMPLAEALEMATLEVVKLNGITTAGEEVPATVPDKPVSDPVGDKQQVQSVQKKLDAAAAQPPEIEGEASPSRGAGAYDIENMTEEDFDALPDSVIKRYRGD